MKKLLTVIVVALASVTLAHAQFGIVGGYTSSTTKLKDAAQEASSASLWHAGVAYKINIGSLAIQPSLTYNMKGTTIDNVQYKSGYLEASAGLQVGLDLLVARPFLVVEPFIGYQVTGNENMNNMKDAVNKLDWGFGLGIGADVLKHLQLRIEWFKNLGALADASKQGAVDALKDTNYQGIKITAGLFF